MPLQGPRLRLPYKQRCGKQRKGDILTLGDDGARQVKGREVTPFVLSRLNELTEGESLRYMFLPLPFPCRANLALVRNNALVGADIAVELASMTSGSRTDPLPPPSTPANHPSPLVVGGSIFDFVVRMREGEVSGLLQAVARCT